MYTLEFEEKALLGWANFVLVAFVCFCLMKAYLLYILKPIFGSNVLTSDFFISHEAVCFSFMGLGKAVLYAFVEEFIFRLMPFMLIWGFYYTNHPLKHFWLILIVCASSIIFGYIHIGSLHPVVIQGGLGLIMYLCFLLGGVFRGRLLSSFWGVTIGHAMYNISIGSFGGSCG